MRNLAGEAPLLSPGAEGRDPRASGLLPHHPGVVGVKAPLSPLGARCCAAGPGLGSRNLPPKTNAIPLKGNSEDTKQLLWIKDVAGVKGGKEASEGGSVE